MSTRLLLEGPDIQALLERVREEHGSSARIVQAERIRSGGIAGFFAKQRFEVAIEVDLDEPVGPVELPAATRAEIEAGPAAAAPVTDTAVPAATASTTAPVAAADDEPVDGEDVTDVAELTRTPAVAAPRDVPWTAVAEQAAGLEGLDPAMVLALAVEDHAERLAAGRATIAGTAASRTATTAAALHATAATASAGRTGNGSVIRIPEPVRQLTPVGPAVRPLQFPQVARPAEPAATPPTRLPVVRPVDELPRRETGHDGPQDVSPSRTATVTPVVPEPPKAPRAAGEVLVLIGDGPDTYRTAAALAQTLRIAAARVLVASPDPVVPGLAAARRVADPVAARSAAASLAAGTSAAIVVVDAPISTSTEPETAQWVREVVRALAGTAVWACVDATRRTADNRRWLAALGHVDGIAAYHVAATEDPDALCALGIPVALLDGQRATAAAWRAVHAALDTDDDIA